LLRRGKRAPGIQIQSIDIKIGAGIIGAALKTRATLKDSSNQALQTRTPIID
jgi:hypothetical protein